MNCQVDSSSFISSKIRHFIEKKNYRKCLHYEKCYTSISITFNEKIT